MLESIEEIAENAFVVGFELLFEVSPFFVGHRGSGVYDGYFFVYVGALGLGTLIPQLFYHVFFFLLPDFEVLEFLVEVTDFIR